MNTLFCLKDIIPNRETDNATIKIDVSELLSDNERTITIDCENTEEFAKLAIVVPYEYTLTILNCDKKLISFFGPNEGHGSGLIYFHGKNNNIFISSGNAAIYGGHNLIHVLSKEGFDSAAIYDDYNEIYGWRKACISIRGNNNEAEFCEYVEADISDKAQNNRICIAGEAFLRNASSSSHIIGMERSKIYSVVEPAILLNFATFHLMYIGNVGEKVCKEPLDNKKGYFYKAVRPNMLPFYSNILAPEYQIGKYYYPDKFDPCPIQCSNGVHFFSDVAHAVAYGKVVQYDNPFIILKLIVEFDDIAPVDSLDEPYYNKYRASKVFVDSIVPEEEYKDIEETLSMPRVLSKEYFNFFPCASEKKIVI